jgi:hypothetical protein
VPKIVTFAISFEACVAVSYGAPLRTLCEGRRPSLRPYMSTATPVLTTTDSACTVGQPRAMPTYARPSTSVIREHFLRKPA